VCGKLKEGAWSKGTSEYTDALFANAVTYKPTSVRAIPSELRGTAVVLDLSSLPSTTLNKTIYIYASAVRIIGRSNATYTGLCLNIAGTGDCFISLYHCNITGTNQGVIYQASNYCDVYLCSEGGGSTLTASVSSCAIDMYYRSLYIIGTSNLTIYGGKGASGSTPEAGLPAIKAKDVYVYTLSGVATTLYGGQGGDGADGIDGDTGRDGGNGVNGAAGAAAIQLEYGGHIVVGAESRVRLYNGDGGNGGNGGNGGTGANGVDGNVGLEMANTWRNGTAGGAGGAGGKGGNGGSGSAYSYSANSQVIFENSGSMDEQAGHTGNGGNGGNGGQGGTGGNGGLNDGTWYVEKPAGLNGGNGGAGGAGGAGGDGYVAGQGGQGGQGGAGGQAGNNVPFGVFHQWSEKGKAGSAGAAGTAGANGKTVKS
jgi:hypothetical protein